MRYAVTNGTRPEGASRKGILRNVAAIIVSRFTGMALRTVGTLLAARYLGVENWGLLGFLTSSLEVFRAIASAGMDTASIRFVSLAREEAGRTVGRLFALKAVTSIIAYLVLVGATLAMPAYRDRAVLVLVLGVGMFPQTLSATLQSRFQAEHAMAKLIVVPFIQGLLYVCGVFVLKHLGAGVWEFVILTVLLDGAQFVAMFVVARRTWPDALKLDSIRFVPSFASAILLPSISQGLLEVVVMLYSRLNVYFLERSGGLAAVGQYAAAMSLSGPLLMVAGALGMSAYPVLSKLVEAKNYGEVTEMFRRYSLRAAGITLVIAVVMSALARPLLTFVSPEFAGGAGALSALAFATAFMFQNQLSSIVLQSFGKFHYVTACAVLNLCVFLATASVLVPRFGPTGGGVTTLITEGVNTIVQLAIVMVVLHNARKRLSAP